MQCQNTTPLLRRSAKKLCNKLRISLKEEVTNTLRHQTISRQIWALKGFYLGYSQKELNAYYCKYEELSLVPTHYMLPALCLNLKGSA